MPSGTDPIREYNGACLERDAEYRRVVFVRDVLDEINKLGTEHLLDASAGRAVIVVWERPTFDGAAGFSE